MQVKEKKTKESFISKYHQDYEKELESVHGIPPAEIYKYPKCREFKQVVQEFALCLCVSICTLTLILSPFQIPTDAGVCHTFNGRPLDQLLKSSSWLTSFK